jgi:hypothetical protein
MSEGSDSGEPKVNGTLLGVPAPRVDSSADSAARRPVFVRSGTSVADVEPPPVPPMALPGRPPGVELTFEQPAQRPASELPPAFSQAEAEATQGNRPSRIAVVARRYPALWMVAAPALLAVGVVAGVAATSTKKTTPPPVAVAPSSSLGAGGSAPRPPPAVEKPRADALAALETKPLESLSASELLKLAEGRSERRLETAQALRKRLEREPGLARDKAVQAELLKHAADAETAREALAALAALDGSFGPDLLYEVWTGTSARNDATELARALLYSTDVRPKASPSLAVALELRQAETCEQFQSALPKALKDGDRRSLHLLAKLGNKRGCGPKKSQDCYPCLRGAPDELTATINAVKSRRAPTVVP